METLAAYIPLDRLQSIVYGLPMPEQAEGAVLFADIVGYTPLVAAVAQGLGQTQGVDVMTRHINRVFEALISEVHQYQGCVVSFGGDAITCWFAADDGLRAVACALAIQKTMSQFIQVKIPPLEPITLTIKVTIASGVARRLRVGDPTIQVLDILTGDAIARLAEVQRYAISGGVVVDAKTMGKIGSQLVVAEWRTDLETGQHHALVNGLASKAVYELALPKASYPTDAIKDLNPDLVRPWLLRPVYERIVSGQGSFLAEIRLVVVLCLLFEGLSYSADDEVGYKLNEYISAVQKTLHRYKGFLIKLTIDDKGSHLLAAFGAPLRYDDAIDGALTAALELRSLATLYPSIDRVQIGLSQGKMLAGAFGSSARAAYDLLGNDATVANRLMMRAQPGQILVTAAIVKDAEAHYQFGSLSWLELKGIREAVPVCELLEEILPIPPEFSTRLIGRERELALMREWRNQVLVGQGSIIRMEGMAGVGKSHLIAKVAAQAKRSGIAVITGTCESAHQTTPYYPWQQLMRSLLGLMPQREPEDADSTELDYAISAKRIEAIVASVNPAWHIHLPLLGEVLNLAIADNSTTASYNAQERKDALIILIGDLLRDLSNRRPVLLLLDDIQWIDEASLHLTLAVCRILAGRSVILLLAHRPFDASQDNELRLQERLQELASLPGYHTLPLSELLPVSIKRLVSERLGGNASPLLLSLVQLQAQGNPFYVEESLAALRELERLRFDSHRQQWTLTAETIDSLRAANCLTIDPGSGDWVVSLAAPLSSVDIDMQNKMEGLVLARVDRLSDEHKFILKTASVIGRIFEADILALAQPGESLPAEVLHRNLNVLEDHNFIYRHRSDSKGSYAFRHDIIQKVTYSSLLQNQQRQLHLAVAVALEKLQNRSVERLAYHYSRSDDGKKALFYLDKAARKAQDDHANRTALTYYRQALALSDHWKWRKGMAEVLHELGELHEERQQLMELSTIQGISDFDLAYLWGQYYEAINDYLPAEREIQRALEAAKSRGELIQEVRCINKLGWMAWKNGGDYKRAEQYYQEALHLIDGWRHYADEEAHALADILNSLGTLYRQQGLYQQAEKSYRQALAMSRSRKNRREEARTLDNLASLAYHQGQFEQAVKNHQAALRIFRTIGHRAGEGDVLHNLALVFQARGEYKEALENLSAVEEIRRSTGDQWETVNVCMQLGILYQELGDLAQAQMHIESGLQIAKQINDLEGRAYLLSNLGLVLRDQGSLKAAADVLTEGLLYMHGKDNQAQMAFFHSYRATVYLAAGDLTKALDDVRKAITFRKTPDPQARLADDLATLALIQKGMHDLPTAVKTVQELWEMIATCGDEGLEAPQRAYFVCFQIFHAAGMQELADTAMQSAHQLVMNRAKKIADPDLRQSYLTQVTINREIIEAYTYFPAKGR